MNIFGENPTAKDAMRERKREMANATRGELNELAVGYLLERTSLFITQQMKEILLLMLNLGYYFFEFPPVQFPVTAHVEGHKNEKKLVLEKKKGTAKTGNEAAAKILACQLIRQRQKITSWQSSRAQMRGIATLTQAMYANTSVAAGMKGATKAMGAMNKLKVKHDFQKQSAQMDLANEMISASIGGVLDDNDAEDETEDLSNQVLDEIDVDIVS